MRKVLAVLAFLVLGVMGAVVCATWPPTSSNAIELGSFLVLGLTLLALGVYAYDTNSIAHVTRETWRRQAILQAGYEMQVVGPPQVPTRRTLFRISNTNSPLVLRARVDCGVRVYGVPVVISADYDGKNTWYVFPQQISQGWFDIDQLVQMAGQSYQQMASQTTAANRTTQLTMDLSIEFRDELGNQRALPVRRHFYDFADHRWVPELTKKDDRFE